MKKFSCGGPGCVTFAATAKQVRERTTAADVVAGRRRGGN